MPKKHTLRGIKGAMSKEAVIHPNSRKATQISRALHRSKSLSARKSDHLNTRLYPLADKLTWFKMRFCENDDSINIPTLGASAEKFDELIEEYLARFDEDLEKLRGELRHGRPVPLKLIEIEAVKKLERQSYLEGSLEIPDLRSAANIKTLKAWTGSVHGIVGQIKLIKVKEPCKSSHESRSMDQS